MVLLVPQYTCPGPTSRSGLPRPPLDLRPELEPAAQARDRARDPQPDRLAANPPTCWPATASTKSRPRSGRCSADCLRTAPWRRETSLRRSPRGGLISTHSSGFTDRPSWTS